LRVEQLGDGEAVLSAPLNWPAPQNMIQFL